MAHIFTGFGFSVGGAAELVELTARTGSPGGSDPYLAVHRGTEGRGIVIVFAAFLPIGTGSVLEQDHSLQGLRIVGIFRVRAGQLKLQGPAGGDLYPRKRELHTIAVLRQIVLGKLSVIRSQHGELKNILLHQSFIVGVSHNQILLIVYFQPAV